MLGDDDPDMFRSGSQDIIQVLELCAVLYQSIKGELVRDLQRKKANSINSTAKIVRAEWIDRIECGCHLRTKCRQERVCIRGKVIMRASVFQLSRLPISPVSRHGRNTC